MLRQRCSQTASPGISQMPCVRVGVNSGLFDLNLMGECDLADVQVTLEFGICEVSCLELQMGV